MLRTSGVALVLLALACTRAPPAPGQGPTVRANAAPPSAVRPGGTAAGSVLAKVRPPAPPCMPEAPYAAPSALAARADAALDDGDADRALACADEALQLAPRLLRALSARAAALDSLARPDEARLAYTRALAIDPDDPDVLLGASELYVRRLGGDHDALEAGMELALRGVRNASRGPHRNADLAARLELVAGMAENDLGHGRDALAHLDKAAAALPDEFDVAYERGLALYELSRLADAERAFQRALALAPDDPWAIHQLGLVAERRGDAKRAAAMLAKARAISPEEFPADLPVDPDAFRAEVRAAVAALPATEQQALAKVPVEVEDLPDSADLVAVDPPLSPSILGLFRGPSEDEPCMTADGPRCRSIVFYRKNLIRFAKDRRELSEQVKVTLLHELGHLHGESDDQLRARGLE
jgi:tetratricopeptide (TPR) repeat protein